MSALPRVELAGRNVEIHLKGSDPMSKRMSSVPGAATMSTVIQGSIPVTNYPSSMPRPRMSSTPKWEAFHSQGLATQILRVTIMFSVICIVVVGFRIWFRWKETCLGIKDWLMSIGLIFNLTHNGIVIWGTFTGIGTPDNKLSNAQILEVEKASHAVLVAVLREWIGVHQVEYMHNTTPQRRPQVSSVAYQGTYCSIGCINYRGNDSCTNQVLDETGFESTDLGRARYECTVSKQSELHASGECASRTLGLQAKSKSSTSIVTIIRMPYSNAYDRATNLCYNIGHVMLWTAVEFDLGVVAGSLSILQTFLCGFVSGKSDQKYTPDQSETNLVTIGRLGRRLHPMHYTTIVATMATGEDKDGPGDSDSTRRMVKAE
ncbi:hypothetical protein BX600DRAFT_439154 [Xylariales sp. PMI_506]|nr:hypothetical protein BX600DRAFT_439154 [Xylariales sp. PMI_506]